MKIKRKGKRKKVRVEEIRTYIAPTSHNGQGKSLRRGREREDNKIAR